MLSHLVYVSSRKAICTAEEITRILEACYRNNSKQNITGVLLYSDQKFVQYLEGEQEAIEMLFDKIKTDPRHRNAVVISSGPTDKRLFPSWEMGHKTIDFNHIEYREEMSKEDQETFQQVLSGQETTRAIKLIKKLFY